MADPSLEEALRERERARLKSRLHAVDLHSALLENWVELAGQNERSDYQTRIGIIFGMAMFITSGATILAAFELDKLALFFAAFMAFVTAFLNHVFEKQTTAWHQTVKILTRIQINAISAVRIGTGDVDLQDMIMTENGLHGSHQPRTLTLYDVARLKREEVRHRQMGWGSWLLYAFIATAALVALLLAWQGDGGEVSAAIHPSSSTLVQRLPPQSE